MNLLGSPTYMATGWLLGTVLMLIALLVNKANVRVEGAGSWIVLILFSCVGGIAARPLIAITGAGVNFAIPYLAVAFMLSIPVFHWLLPAVAPDLQIRTLGVSLMLAVAVGFGFMLSAIVLGMTLGWVPSSALAPPQIPTE